MTDQLRAVTTGTLLANSLRLELYADDKLVAKQEVLVPRGLKLKTAALCATELLNNAIIGRVPEALQGMGFK
jgi:hypothetical protein